MKVAIFDFDETVVNTDSFFSLIRYFLTRSKVRVFFAIGLAPAAVLLLRFKATQRLGVSIPFWIGTAFRTKRDVVAMAKEFAQTFETRGEGRLFLQAIKEMRRLQDEGYKILVVTAAPRIISRQLLLTQGLRPRIFGSRFSFWAGGVCQTRRCYGAVKVQTLHERGIYAADVGYTDSKSDFPLLDLCKSQVLINPSERLLISARRRFPSVTAKVWN